jgi:Domain of unknown function (DUF4436)
MRLPGRRPPGGQSEGAPAAPEGAPHHARSTRWLLIAALLLFMAAGLLISLSIPSRGSATGGADFANLTVEPTHRNQPSTLRLDVTLESVDAAQGSVQVQMVATPEEQLPPEGAVVFSSLRSNPAVVVKPGKLNPAVSATVPFASGNIADYPFDNYRATVALLVLSGSDTTIPTSLSERRLLPYEIHAISDVAGFNATGAIRPATEATDQALGAQYMDLDLERSFSTRGWVVATMAIYWALALASAAITVAIIVRRRPFDPRILAFLGALLFALIAFRNAAPGNPPIGTFLDFYAMFESVGIVAISLLALMITYLARTREGLDMI